MMHKPIIKTLKPVVEAEGPFARMENSLDELLPRNASPKQNVEASSPMQEDYMQMNGPPGKKINHPINYLSIKIPIHLAI